MGERDAGASSSSLAGGETQLEGIVIHKNNANTPPPATKSVVLVSEGEKGQALGQGCKRVLHSSELSSQVQRREVYSLDGS
ncbi:hypothetical protein Patl1_22883 [Pistacia atlantica]|uniref:Uncharacterized protein n=1 Tax=Pistacia atlantica TaxID=434234 RepID=A0ACC0ZXE5_9ROSI|nr:hypothetical protein Patl1_22883 [Pistacia atlantica]